MQMETRKFIGSSRIYVAAAIFLFTGLFIMAQSYEPSLIGSWQGIMYSNISAANGAIVKCVFQAQGEYTCMLSKPGIGSVRHWGRYQAIGGDLELQIQGHEPDSITMPPQDHMQIVSLTAHTLTTRGTVGSVYEVVNFRRAQ